MTPGDVRGGSIKRVASAVGEGSAAISISVMDTIQKAILISLISIAAISWAFSNYQPDMMKAMLTYDPIAISLFTISWTVGMAAMMFPSITPMVLLYNRLIRANGDGRDNTKDDMETMQ